jgi:hypothetical protein
MSKESFSYSDEKYVAGLEREMEAAEKERDDFRFKAAQLTTCLRAAVMYIDTVWPADPVRSGLSTLRHCLKHNSVEHRALTADGAAGVEGKPI